MTVIAGRTPAATQWFQRARLMRQAQLSKLAQSGVLVSSISQLVHMLQCERGASNVWLCSQGKLYAPECKASRALVDENLAALHRILDAQSPLPGSATCSVSCRSLMTALTTRTSRAVLWRFIA
jgi:hypothetical protein